MIKSIHIKNIKGIDDTPFELNIYPNKVAILVAPNGYGKSSIATAFESMNRDRIKLDENDYPKGDTTKIPLVSLETDDFRKTEVLVADNQHNEIKKNYDVIVINSNIFSETKKQSFGKFSVATSRITVEPIVLVDKIPAKQSFPYEYKKYKATYNLGNTLPNITQLLNSPQAVKNICKNANFKLYENKTSSKIINKIKEDLKNSNESGKKLKGRIESTDAFKKFIERENSDNCIMHILKPYTSSYSQFDKVMSALQIIDIYKNDNPAFKRTKEYCSYQRNKKHYENIYKFFDQTWCNITPIEKKGKLIVKFPDVTQISNGQRDFLNFISQCLCIRNNISKTHVILIIDEIFDYLDDSNLICVQYFISRYTRSFKKTHKNIYPIILTHLNPYYFNNYRFQKPQIRYLFKTTQSLNADVEKLIENRENIKTLDATLNEGLNQYYFHYNPEFDQKDFSKDFLAIKFKENLNTPLKFRNVVFSALRKYISNNVIDPVSICCAIRLIIEEYVYNQLTDNAMQQSFLKTFKTDAKIDFAIDHGIELPEIFNLLGIIYNDGMHLKNGVDKITPITLKLQNTIIKKIIKAVCIMCNFS